ncbi:MAG: PH domain-containing protein [Gammaproteobacteria bacterium]|nr:PH domain-containing protein [Gammaproteobacteria bacterium]
MTEELLVSEAEFTQKVCNYWVTQGALALVFSIVGIPLLLIWIPVGLFFSRHYLRKMECKLTNKALKFKKGLLVKVEKTIPLEKITDMGLEQGPLMRFFGIYKLTVETAGQSGHGALVSLLGIVETKTFRAKVLKQREKFMIKSHRETEVSSVDESPDNVALLVDIRDALLRIEKRLEKS